MKREAQVEFLIRILLEEMPYYRGRAESFPREGEGRRRLLRGLMNLRPPMPLRPDFLAVQDALLSAEREERGVVDVGRLPAVAADPRLVLWQGDITRLNADAVVNAGNGELLGCFSPCHGCIDNVIHSAAGLQLREECSRLMLEQGHPEPPGRAKITGAYNLPSRYVLHTVGPIVAGPLRRRDCDLLASCYRSCLEPAGRKGIKSLAFCCISTGVYHCPNQKAAGIAVETVRGLLDRGGDIRVIFNVFKNADMQIYRGILGEDLAAEAGD